MLDTHRLRVFRAVVASGSVSGAAETLGYTPSAVSQQLSALQRETGLALVERTGRGITPTPAGLRFAQETDVVLRGLSGLDAVAADLRQGRVGSLTLRYIASAGTAWIPPVVAVLIREFPDLRMVLRLVELAAEDPHSPDPDLEIVVEDAMRPFAERADVHALVEEPYVVVLPTDHPLAGRTGVRLAELEHETWVDNDVVRGPCRDILLTSCAASGFVPDFRIEAHDYPTAVSFVAAGVGITALARLGAWSLPEGAVAVPLVDPTPRRRIVLRVRSAVRDHPAVMRARELLVAVATGGTAPGAAVSGAR